MPPWGSSCLRQLLSLQGGPDEPNQRAQELHLDAAEPLGPDLACSQLVEDVEVRLAKTLARCPLARLPQPHSLAAHADKLTDFLKAGARPNTDRAPSRRRRQPRPNDLPRSHQTSLPIILDSRAAMLPIKTSHVKAGPGSTPGPAPTASHPSGRRVRAGRLREPSRASLLIAGRLLTVDR